MPNFSRFGQVVWSGPWGLGGWKLTSSHNWRQSVISQPPDLGSNSWEDAGPRLLCLRFPADVAASPPPTELPPEIPEEVPLISSITSEILIAVSDISSENFCIWLRAEFMVFRTPEEKGKRRQIKREKGVKAQTDRQADAQTDRQADVQTNRHTGRFLYPRPRPPTRRVCAWRAVRSPCK